MKERYAKITEVLALLTLAVFALCVLLVLLTGAGTYRNLVDRSGESHARRTALGYLTTRVRQAETVELAAFQGCEALVLGETVQGERYVTRIYCHEGWLMELFSTADGTFTPEDGEKILPLRAMSLTHQDGTVTAALTDEAGVTRSVTIYLRGGEEAAP